MQHNHTTQDQGVIIPTLEQWTEARSSHSTGKYQTLN